MTKILTIIFLIFAHLTIAQPKSTLIYNPSNENFRNPERGFSADSYSPLTQSFISSVKAQNISVIHRVYTIPQLRNTLLSDSLLTTVENDLVNARNGGVKLVIRFSYTHDIDGEDAALDTILMHINQLKPVLQKHYDVIAYMEAGFIGAWGEWYYSTHHLNNTNDRRTVLFALLDALPVERSVVIRTPDYKRKIFQDNNPLTLAEAFSGTKKARTGAHNDCFLASATDYGTYLSDDIEGDKNYLNQDNRFVPQGGETCNPSSYSGCSNALIDLNRMHWSVLNKDYHPDVLQGWVNEGCMEEIKKRLGYRFSLVKATVVDSVKPGGIFSLSFDVENSGFANPYNPRGLEIILRNTTTKAKYKLVTGVDPRFWFSGDTTAVNIEGGIKQTMPEGVYDVLLFLPDTIKNLHDRKDYAIWLANESVWEDSTGYNNLLHQVIINSGASGDNYTGDNYFELFASGVNPPDSNGQIIIDGDFGDWSDNYKLDKPPLEENAGDALNSNVDLLDLWMTSSNDEVYFSYKTASNFSQQYFYHVFIDTDNDTATGFHSGGSYSGFDYMVENSSLWKYAGTNGEWNWSYAGETVYAQGTSESSRVELAIPFSQLNIHTSRVIGVVFNINDNDENVDDDYAPDSYQTESYQYSIVITSVEEPAEGKLPGQFQIEAYPNPFNGFVNIIIPEFDEEIIGSAIYDINGKKIKEFTQNEIRNSRIIWNGRNLFNEEAGSGIYFFRLETRRRKFIKKIVLLK